MRSSDTITERIGVPMATEPGGEHRNAAPRAGGIDDDLDRRLTDGFRDDVAALSTLLGVTPPWPRFAASSSPTDLPKSL